MIFTIRKATLGAADLLRLLHSIDENCTQFTAFAIPNCTEPHAIVKIQVKWSSFKFETTNTIYENLIEGIEEMEAVMRTQMESLPEFAQLHNNMSRFMTKLSWRECNLVTFCSDCEQLPSHTHHARQLLIPLMK